MKQNNENLHHFSCSGSGAKRSQAFQLSWVCVFLNEKKLIIFPEMDFSPILTIANVTGSAQTCSHTIIAVVMVRWQIEE